MLPLPPLPLAALAVVWVTALATETDPVAWLVNYGVAGVVIALLVMGRLRTKSEVDGLKEQVAELRGDLLAERTANAALVAQVTSHTLPQMTNLADVLDALPSKAVQHTEDRLVKALGDLSAKLDQIETQAGGRK